LLEKLEERCLQPIEEFRKLGTVVADTKHGPLIHIDRGSKVIGVAHMDTVARKPPKSVIWQQPKRHSLPVINSIQLDDRLGCWTMLDLLPAMGLKFDVLLCDSEERGASTADQFKPTREYNWGFEFDRAGTNTVLYDYDDDDTWRSALKTAGFDIQMGSFSDISSLTHVGCCFANFGVGYHYQHSPNCYASLDDTVLMALEFETWYKANKDTAYKYTHEDRWSDSEWGRIWNSRRGWVRGNDGWTRTKTGTWSKTYQHGDREQSVERNGWPDKTEAICPECDNPVSFASGIVQSTLYSCPWCKKTSKGSEFRVTKEATCVDTMPRCNWCGARHWDDRGVCEVCGYDPQIDRPLDNDLVVECPICGGDMDEDYCCYCGYVEEYTK